MKSKNTNSLSTEIRRNNMDEPRVYPTERITVPWEYYVMLARLVPIDVTKFDRLVRSLARQGCISNKQMISTSFEELTCDLKELEFVSIDEFHTSIPSPCYELTFGKELKGFHRIALKAGERQHVTIPIRRADLCNWDEASQDWKFEPGKIMVLVGGSSNNLILKTKTKIQ